MAIIAVKVYTKASRNEVIEKDGKLLCYVTKSPFKNQANKEVIRLLSKFWKISKSCIVIRRGVKSNIKYIERLC